MYNFSDNSAYNNNTYAIQVVHVSSSEDSPLKDGLQAKRKMRGTISKRKLFAAVDEGQQCMMNDQKANAWYSYKFILLIKSSLIT